MEHIRITVCFVILLGTLPGTGLGGQAGEPILAVHSISDTFKGHPCQFGPQGIPCADFEVSRSSHQVWWVYLTVVRADSASGVSEFSVGIDRSSDMDIFWVLCADHESLAGTWPETGTGIRLSWDTPDNCQRDVFGTDGVYAVGGVLNIYAYGEEWMRVTPNAADGESSMVVTDCNGTVTTVEGPGAMMGFGGVTGFNPCLGDVPVTPSSWGRIKTQYQR